MAEVLIIDGKEGELVGAGRAFSTNEYQQGANYAGYTKGGQNYQETYYKSGQAPIVQEQTYIRGGQGNIVQEQSYSNYKSSVPAGYQNTTTTYQNTYVPNTTQSYVPNTTQSYVPNTTQSYVNQGYNETVHNVVQGVSGSQVGGVSSSKVVTTSVRDKEVIKGQSRIQYVPFEKKVIQYKDNTVREKVQVKKIVNEVVDKREVRRIPKEVTVKDFYAVEYLRQYIPQYIPETHVEYIQEPVKRTRLEYVPVQRKIVHMPSEQTEGTYAASSSYVQPVANSRTVQGITEQVYKTNYTGQTVNTGQTVVTGGQRTSGTQEVNGRYLTGAIVTGAPIQSSTGQYSTNHYVSGGQSGGQYTNEVQYTSTNTGKTVPASLNTAANYAVSGTNANYAVSGNTNYAVSGTNAANYAGGFQPATSGYPTGGYPTGGFQSNNYKTSLPAGYEYENVIHEN